MNPVAQSHALVDRYMTAASARSAQLGKPVRCLGPGCFGCCKEPVQIERAEAVYIIEGLSEAQRVAVTARTAEWASKFEANPVSSMASPEALEKIKDFTWLFRYRAAQLWCPLLENGKCVAYERRPASCRYHAAVAHPVKCHDDTQRQRQKFMTTDEQSKVSAKSLVLLCQNAPCALFEFDHLGVWLKQLLFGSDYRSGAGRNVMVTQTDPKDMEAETHA